MNDAFFDNLFELFHRRRVVLLAGQEGWDRLPINPGLEDRAGAFFGQDNMMHVVPPDQASEPADFYAALAGRFGVTRGVDSPVTFIRAVDTLLGSKRRMLLLITGFERSHDAMLASFAGTLRTMDDQHASRLRILICGGEKLDGLYFQGALSYLNSAEMVKWPEPTADDVCRLCARACGHASVADASACDLDELKSRLRETIPGSDEDKAIREEIRRMESGRTAPVGAAEAILWITGGHPMLLEAAFRHCGPESGFDADACRAALEILPQAWQLFTPFRDTPDANAVCGLLGRAEVGFNQPFLFDPLIRRLYWANLLRPDKTGERLVWRCEVLMTVGRKILCAG